MKALLAVLAVLILASGFVGAATISAPESVPANVSWGFSVNLGGATAAKVIVDSATIVEIQSDGAIVSRPFSGQYVLNQGAGIIYVSHFGLAEGSHTISVEAGNGNDSKTINAFKALDDSFRAEIQTQVNTTLDSKLVDVDAAIKGQQADNEEMWRNIQETKTKVDSFDSKVTEIDSSVGSKVAALDERLKPLEAAEAEKQATLLAEEEARKNSPITGFVTFAQGNVIPLAFIVIVVVVGAVLFITKADSISSIYSGIRWDENKLPLSRDQQAAIEEISKEGTWAYGKKQ